MNTNYRVYPDGSIYHQDVFAEADIARNHADDYETVSVPDIIVEFIEDCVLGK